MSDADQLAPFEWKSMRSHVITLLADRGNAEAIAELHELVEQSPEWVAWIVDRLALPPDTWTRYDAAARELAMFRTTESRYVFVAVTEAPASKRASGERALRSVNLDLDAATLAQAQRAYSAAVARAWNGAVGRFV
jgi:hypothetical protein